MSLPFARSRIEELSGARFTDGNRVHLLYKGRDSFDALFRSVEEAERFICLQFYIFRNDETGTELARLLREKARSGVKVYVLYDHFGSLGTPRRFWKELRDDGISLRASRPFIWLSPLHYARRDHRKLLIIDYVKAFTGGLNIANEYRGFHLRKRGGWRDTGIILEGPVVPDLFATFERSWSTWGGEPIPFSRPPESPFSASVPEVTVSAIPIFASSAKGRRRMRKLLYYSIATAQRSIFLTTAYFTPSRRMLSSLEEAVNRGVDVRLLLPGQSDVPAAYYAARAFFTRLLKAGVRIFAYRGEMMHAKSYVFDGCWSIVGSANLDFQSLRRNDEGNVGILNDDFGRAMTAVFAEDSSRALEVDEGEWSRRPFTEKIKERFFALFRRRL
jgi:cardiolipin synthase